MNNEFKKEEIKIKPMFITAVKDTFKQAGRRVLGYLHDTKKMLAVIGVLLIVWLLWMLLGDLGLIAGGDFPYVSGSKYQAVFLTNGQVYFGHLQNYNRKYAILKDIYYLQTAQSFQQGQPPAPNMSLVKLGSELHGPEDVMFVPKDNILFWENMRSDSQVVKAIELATGK